jgi:hypothetical protein
MACARCACCNDRPSLSQIRYPGTRRCWVRIRQRLLHLAGLDHTLVGGSDRDWQWSVSRLHCAIGQRKTKADAATKTQQRPNNCVSSRRSKFQFTGRVGASRPNDQPERDVWRYLDTGSDKLAPPLNPQVLGSSPRGRTDWTVKDQFTVLTRRFVTPCALLP